MSLDGALNYILFTNPISSATGSAILNTSQFIVSKFQGLTPKHETTIIKMDPLPLWKLAQSGGIFVRIAGISGACAVILGAYGAHKILPDKNYDDSQKRIFETANRYHFFHTIALLGVPLGRYSALSGSLFLLGITMFCGSSYYSSITGDNRFRRITPIGGTCLILGWLSLVV